MNRIPTSPAFYSSNGVTERREEHREATIALARLRSAPVLGVLGGTWPGIGMAAPPQKRFALLLPSRAPAREFAALTDFCLAQTPDGVVKSAVAPPTAGENV
jgi:hypothetical protein